MDDIPGKRKTYSPVLWVFLKETQPRRAGSVYFSSDGIGFEIRVARRLDSDISISTITFEPHVAGGEGTELRLSDICQSVCLY